MIINEYIKICLTQEQLTSPSDKISSLFSRLNATMSWGILRNVNPELPDAHYLEPICFKSVQPSHHLPPPKARHLTHPYPGLVLPDCHFCHAMLSDGYTLGTTATTHIRESRRQFLCPLKQKNSNFLNDGRHLNLSSMSPEQST